MKSQDAGKYICAASSAGIFTTSTSVQLSVLACRPVGVADINKIPDARMSSSSHYDKYFAFYGRLNGQEAAEDGVLGPKMTEETTFKSTWERSTPYVLWQRKGNSPDHISQATNCISPLMG